MRYAQKTAILIATVALATAIAPPARSQTTAKPISQSRAENIAHRFELNAGTITVFDRKGRLLKTVGPRGLYGVTIFSPDGKRLAVIKIDPEQQNRDLWVFDIDTGGATRITTSERGEGAFFPAWSPDGSQLAYRALRGGSYGFYRKASNGQGPEELLYNFPGSPTLMDWSLDGRFLTVLDSGLGGSTISVLPLGGERKPIEVVRSPKQLGGGWTSPDSRFIAYNSNESGRTDLYVRTRDSADGGAESGPWRITTRVALGASAIGIPDGIGFGAFAWRGDGKELYYLGPDQGVMAVAITTSPTFKPAEPKLLFRKPVEEFSGLHVSRDGERFVMIAIPSKLRQITIFDRQGKLVKTVGAPGMYGDLAISPDQTRVAVDRIDPKTGNLDIWTFDLANGKGSAVTNDFWPDFNPVWLPDGKRLAYVSVRTETSGIYEKPSDGTGVEELVFRHTPGATDRATDWSPDGKFLAFSDGAMSMIPLRPGEKATDRKSMEWLAADYEVWDGRFSPDTRYFAYSTNEADVFRYEVFVRPFDASKTEAPDPAVQVSKDGIRGSESRDRDGTVDINWRRDGKELYFVSRKMEVTAVDVTTTPALKVGTPKVLFRLDGLISDGGSLDGQRFVFLMPVRK